MKATELLQKQHRDIEQLLERVKAGGEDKTVREDLARLLVAHTGIEEEIFYPALQHATPELVHAAIEEHGLADYELGRILASKADADAQSAKIDVLAEVVLLHIRKEEADLFRVAERALGHEELQSLGQEMEPRFRELSASGYMRLLQRSITKNTPRLAAIRGERTRKPARRAAAPKKTTPKAKRGTTGQRGTTAKRGATKARGTTGQRGRAGSRKGKSTRAGASSRSRTAG